MSKPSPHPRDPGPAIEAILRDAARKILSLLQSDQTTRFAALDQRLARPSAEPATPTRQRAASPRPPARDHRVPTTEVASTLRRLFAAEDRGLRLADLRASTGYGNMQLHRALQLLLSEGEIRKRGKDRKTEYLRARSRPAAHRPAITRGRGKKVDR